MFIIDNDVALIYISECYLLDI